MVCRPFYRAFLRGSYVMARPAPHDVRKLTMQERSWVEGTRRRERMGERLEERRRFVRLPARLHASYQIVSVRRHLTSLTRDTGGGGIGFFTESSLAPGTVLEVQVQFPNRQRAVEFTAEVVWSGKLLLDSTDDRPRAFETGVRFLDISSEDQAFIMQYSASNAPSPSAPER